MGTERTLCLLVMEATIVLAWLEMPMKDHLGLVLNKAGLIFLQDF